LTKKKLSEIIGRKEGPRNFSVGKIMVMLSISAKEGRGTEFFSRKERRTFLKNERNAPVSE
jgi:hypothetical protein